MDIKRGEGYVLQSVPITADAVKVEELMKQDSITLSWRSVVNEIIPLGAYVEYEGERYTLLAPYSPSQISEIEYEYKPVFHSRIMRWQHIPFFHYNKVDGNIVSKEPDWTLTDNPANFMAVICDAISNETGEEWTYSIADNLPASTSLSFSNVDIFSALNSIANAFNTEWWADKVNNVLHLSKASFGDPAILEVGDNIKVPSVTNSKDGYYTRFYAFGSTRNIAQDYQGANVNTQTNRRLTLDPVKYPNGYKDIRENLTDDEVLSKVLFFDKVYPKSDLVISDVRVRLMWVLDDNKDKVQVGTDENGDPIYSQYAIWYFKIPGYEYDENALIPAKPLSVHFNSGSLAGREFELSYDGKMKDLDTADGSKFVKDADDYEILFIEEGSYIIPAITGLVPNDGDEITLFNIVMPEEYKQSAYSELEEELDNEIARMQSDLNNYSFESNKVAFYNSNPNLSIGRSVTYKNGSYSYSTRVIKLETKIDYPFEQKITIGNEQIKGNTQELKEEVVNANQNIDLLASINKMTNSITQAYQRTQKSILDSISKYNDMFGVDPNGDVYVKPLPGGTPRNFYSFGEVSSGGIGGNDEEEEGSGTGITSLYDIPEVEVDLEALEDGQSLVYNVDLGKWVNRLVQGGSGSGVSILEKSQLGSLEEENLSQTFSAYAIDSIYKQVQELLKGGIGDYLTKDIADTYYAPLSYFDSNGVANKAYLLKDAPSLGKNGNSIYVIAGKQQSLNFTVPYATKAGTADSVSKLSLTDSYTIFSQKFFDNGVPVSIDKGSTLSGLGSLTPHSSNEYDLGTTSSKWKTLYVSNISGLSTLSISGTLSVGGTSAFTGKTTHNGGLEGTTGAFSSTLNVAGAVTFGDTEENAIFFGSSGAKIWWDSENQCVRTNFNFAADGEVSSGGIGDGIGGSTGETDGALTVNGILTVTQGLIAKGAQFGTASEPASIDVWGGIYAMDYIYLYNKLTEGNRYATIRFDDEQYLDVSSIIKCVSVIQSSDVTLKNIKEDVLLSNEVIANAPMFRYTWIGGDGIDHIGTSAQYWAEHTPELAPIFNGIYGLDYSTLGVLMGKSNASEIERLKERVKELENEVTRLKGGNYDNI